MTAVLAALAVVPAGCPGSPRLTARPTPRAAPAQPVRVLLELPAAERVVRLLGVDRQRREVHLLASSAGPPPAERLVTVPLHPGRPPASWTLPAPATAWLREGQWSGYDRVRGTPWLARLLAVQVSAGPWYLTRQPALLDVDPTGSWLALRTSADYLDLVPARGGPARPLNGGSPACYQPAFSPDGRTLAYSCFSRVHHEYCPTFQPVTAAADAALPGPRQVCEPRGYAASGPYWQPDSRAFLVLVRRGLGAYLDPVQRLCLVRVDVPDGRSTALWCQDLDRQRDQHLELSFRPDPTGETGVVLLADPSAGRCRFSARWIRLRDGQVLASHDRLPIGYSLGSFTVVNAVGRLLVPACDRGLLSVDLRTGEARRLLPGRQLAGGDWDGADHLVALEYRFPLPYRLVEVDLRVVP
jgi:hypothetical protein